MQRFQMRKEELISHSEKDNKENIQIHQGLGLRQSNKQKLCSENRDRRIT